MKDLLDRYTFLARFLPVAVVLLPVGFAVAAWFPEGFEGRSLLVGLAVTSALTMVLAQLGRDLGKRKQAALFASWGGQPTLAMLRHRDNRLDRLTLARYHEKLAALVPNAPAPSARAENGNSAAADTVYKSWIHYLLEATRDRTKFRLLFAENISYGFRRNLWGMKPAGILLAVIGALAVVVRLVVAYWTTGTVLPIAGAALAVDVTLLVLWTFRIRPDWVRLVADAYAERLLAACEILDVKPEAKVEAR